MKKISIIACMCLIWAAPAAADVVVDWNIRAAQSINAGGRRGPSGLIDFAMVHVAMHDAIQAVEGRFETYCGTTLSASGSEIAAAAAAAHGVLVALFPSDDSVTALNASLAASLEKYSVTGNAGVSAGEQAAACILGRLDGDNKSRAIPDTFVGGQGPGQWRPVGTAPMAAQFLATMAPYTFTDPAQFRASNPPPQLTSGAYAKAYNEVKALGALNGSTRTDEQTNIGLFFTETPAAYWTGAMRSLASTHLDNIGDSARMFGLVYLAMADSAITAWDSKVAWNFWRPNTAIQLGDTDGNSRTDGDPDWQPLRATPNYPDYTSGANNGTGSATTMLANFFGTDEVAFSLTSTFIAAPNNVRNYTRLSDAQQDVVDARIYMGIHFRFADTAGLLQGKRIANWVFGHFLRPVGGGDN
jgi:hypothetical protein